MTDFEGNILEVGDTAYAAYNSRFYVVTIYEVNENLRSFTVLLPNGNKTGANSECLLLKQKQQFPNELHASHRSVRSSDASTFDFICDDCGATDRASGGWAGLSKPCKGYAP